MSTPSTVSPLGRTRFCMLQLFSIRLARRAPKPPSLKGRCCRSVYRTPTAYTTRWWDLMVMPIAQKSKRGPGK